MPDEPVVNSSPLIHLSRADMLSLLHAAGPSIVVPDPVAAEIRAKGPGDVTVRALDSTPWLRVVPATTIPPEIVAWDLGSGEAAVLALARVQTGALAIIDDRQARRCATTLGVPFTGTVGIVLRAKRKGIIGLAQPVLRKLVAEGMFLSERVIVEALALVGE